jgi:hypothetical protein
MLQQPLLLLQRLLCPRFFHSHSLCFKFHLQFHALPQLLRR